MANLAEAIQGLVHHMRTEQQMIRDWVDSQAEQHRDIRRLLEILVRENMQQSRSAMALARARRDPRHRTTGRASSTRCRR